MNIPLSKPALAFSLLSTLMLAGCAGGGKGITDGKNTLAVIEAIRGKTSAGDCPVTLSIANRTGVAWDGASYHLAMHNRSGVSIGRLLGSPRKKTPEGEALVDAGRVLGVKCEDITGAALVYFGYYPTGKKEVHAHVNSVRVVLK